MVKLAAMRFTIVLERSRECLVEVVQVEDQRPLGRRERAEVRQMRVAAELRAETGGRSGRAGRQP